MMPAHYLHLNDVFQVLNPVAVGSVQKVLVQSELVLCQVPGLRDRDARFQYFIQELLPQFQSCLRMHTMVFIPDYCDYIRILRYLKEDGGLSISTINEYMVGVSIECNFIFSQYVEIAFGF